MYYIMLPELYYSLTNVRGFSDLNGKTYKEHIVVILENVLTDEQWREFVRQYGKGVSVDGVIDWENISVEFDNFCEESK